MKPVLQILRRSGRIKVLTLSIDEGQDDTGPAILKGSGRKKLLTLSTDEGQDDTDVRFRSSQFFPNHIKGLQSKDTDSLLPTTIIAPDWNQTTHFPIPYLKGHWFTSQTPCGRYFTI
ncbi:hypothetical protein GQ457_12G015940 [Hibiscus cannabinus]